MASGKENKDIQMTRARIREIASRYLPDPTQRGVEAQVDIPKGTPVADYTGELLDKTQIETRYPGSQVGRYAINVVPGRWWIDAIHEKQGLGRLINSVRTDANFQVLREILYALDTSTNNTLSDKKVKEDFAVFCTPSANVEYVRNEKMKTVTIYTTRNVRQGEELLVSYGDEYFNTGAEYQWIVEHIQHGMMAQSIVTIYDLYKLLYIDFLTEVVSLPTSPSFQTQIQQALKDFAKYGNVTEQTQRESHASALSRIQWCWIDLPYVNKQILRWYTHEVQVRVARFHGEVNNPAQLLAVTNQIYNFYLGFSGAAIKTLIAPSPSSSASASSSQTAVGALALQRITDADCIPLLTYHLTKRKRSLSSSSTSLEKEIRPEETEIKAGTLDHDLVASCKVAEGLRTSFLPWSNLYRTWIFLPIEGQEQDDEKDALEKGDLLQNAKKRAKILSQLWQLELDYRFPSADEGNDEGSEDENGSEEEKGSEEGSEEEEEEK